MRSESVPSGSELVGTYYMGDGLGICMEVTLRPDGALSGVACGAEHIGVPGREFTGTWSLSGPILHVATPAGEIGDSEVFFWQGSPAFVELENKRGNRVERWAVFHKATR
ncbi:hypothetical protein GCM10027432_09800 [Lysobacter fragariae]